MGTVVQQWVMELAERRLTCSGASHVSPDQRPLQTSSPSTCRSSFPSTRQGCQTDRRRSTGWLDRLVKRASFASLLCRRQSCHPCDRPRRLPCCFRECSCTRHGAAFQCQEAKS